MRSSPSAIVCNRRPGAARRARLSGLVLACAAALWTAPAGAQIVASDYGTLQMPMSSFLATSYLTQSVVNDLHTPERLRSAARAPREGASAAALLVSTRGPATMPARLASFYPADRQPQARALFADLLQRYRGIETQFGLAHGDLGGALAAFLVGSWMGLHDRPFADEHFMPVVRQMRTLLAAQPELAKAPAADRREMYEQLAILGMLMAGTRMALQQQPDAATQQRLREAARGYLGQFFKVDAERIGFGPAGLRID